MLCECFNTCEFLRNMRTTDRLTADTVKITYCEDNKYSCARYGLLQVMAADEIPDFIWPNDEEDALELIKASSRNREKNSHGLPV